MSADAKERIRALNDRLRTTGLGGRVFITAGVEALGQALSADALTAVRSFTVFTADNDPHDEHDFGVVHVAGCKLFWKIDYYDAAMVYGSEDPADPSVTTRVLTIMLAEEY